MLLSLLLWSLLFLLTFYLEHRGLWGYFLRVLIPNNLLTLLDIALKILKKRLIVMRHYVLIIAILQSWHIKSADRIILLADLQSLLFWLSRFRLKLTLLLAIEPTTLLATNSSIFILQSLKPLLYAPVSLIYWYLVQISRALWPNRGFKPFVQLWFLLRHLLVRIVLISLKRFLIWWSFQLHAWWNLTVRCELDFDFRCSVDVYFAADWPRTLVKPLALVNTCCFGPIFMVKCHPHFIFVFFSAWLLCIV